MRSLRTVGITFIVGALGVFIPYTVLTITFNYPDVLRMDTAIILQKFHEGGPSLILTWLAFGLMGIPLLIGYAILGKTLERELPFVRWITTIGIISGVVQIIGLLRWVFVVPVISSQYQSTTDPSTRAALKVGFDLINQFGGVLLGEHLGQLFTVIWTFGICIAILKVSLLPRWISTMGIISASIYFLAQGELLATVIPGFPAISWAGFLGSILWLVWLLVVGIGLVREESKRVGE